MSILLFPGSFDPFTLGHLDIAKRASRQCDKLVVAVMGNSAKKPAFTPDERAHMASLALSKYENVEVITYDGLLVDLFKEIGCSAVVRGIRSESDFRYEAEMAMANRLLYPKYEVLLLPCRENLSMTSSTIVKEVCYYGGDISKMLPPEIVDIVTKGLKKGRS